MFQLLASSYEYTNGQCYVDGALQATAERCTNVAHTLLGVGAAILGILFVIAIISLVFFVFWVIQVIHAISHQDLPDRTVWIIALIAAFFLGFIWVIVPVYYFAVMRKYKPDLWKTGAPNQQQETTQSPPEAEVIKPPQTPKNKK